MNDLKIYDDSDKNVKNFYSQYSKLHAYSFDFTDKINWKK